MRSVLLALALAYSASALVYKFDNHTNNQLEWAYLTGFTYDSEYFGLREGGTLDFDISFTSDSNLPVHVLLLNFHQKEGLERLLSHVEDLAVPEAIRYHTLWGDSNRFQQSIGAVRHYQVSMNGGRIQESYRHQVVDSTRYSWEARLGASSERFHVVLLNPNSQSYSATGDMRFINPTMYGGDSHLSSQDLHLPYISLSIFVVYTVMAVVWIMLLVNRWHNVITPQYLISVALFCLWLQSLVVFSFYLAENTDGKGRAQEAGVRISMNVVADIFQLMGLTTMFGVAFGWQITHAALLPREVKMMLLIVGSYTFVCCIQYMCVFTSDVCYFLSLIKFLELLFLLVGVIIVLNLTISTLRYSLDTVSMSDTPHMFHKLHIYRRARVLFIMLLAVPTFFYILSLAVLSWRDRWVEVVARDLIAMPTIYALLAYGWRPHKHLPWSRRMRRSRRRNREGDENAGDNHGG